MSARSFAHRSGPARQRPLARFIPGVLVALAACSGTSKPEADPTKVQAIANQMANNPPPLAGMRACQVEDFRLPAMTQPTLLKLAHQEVPASPERLPWMNPAEVDVPYARVLIDSTDDKQRRQAAAEFLGAKGYMVWRVDMLDVPLALEIKELKRGAVGIRAIGYDKGGNAVCVKQFTVQNDKAVSESAMQRSDKARVDPKIAQELRDDLKVQLLAKIEQFRAGP